MKDTYIVSKNMKSFTFLSLSLAGGRDQDYWQTVWPTGVSVLAEHQSHCSPSGELPAFRDSTADQSEGFLVCVGKCDRSDGQGLLQHRAKRSVPVGAGKHTHVLPSGQHSGEIMGLRCVKDQVWTSVLACPDQWLKPRAGAAPNYSSRTKLKQNCQQL